jgi:ABC-type branched-subunit amino acid transport system substrate-binding protein
VRYTAGEIPGVAAGEARAGTEVVLFLGDGVDTRLWLETLAALGEAWQPQTLALSALIGEVPPLPASIRERLYLAAPTLAVDRQPRGLRLYEELAREAGLPGHSPSVQLSALAAVQVLHAALLEAGREVSRERLVTALEALYAFQTGLTPPLTFGPNRRAGALGAYIAQLEEDGRLLPVMGWVTPR